MRRGSGHHTHRRRGKPNMPRFLPASPSPQPDLLDDVLRGRGLAPSPCSGSAPRCSAMMLYEPGRRPEGVPSGFIPYLRKKARSSLSSWASILASAFRRHASRAASPAGIVARLAAPVGSQAAGMLIAACAVPSAAASASSCFSKARVSSEKTGLSKLVVVGLWHAAISKAVIAAATMRERCPTPVPEPLLISC